MPTSKILAVTVGVLVLSAGMPLADVTDSGVGKESVTPQEHIQKPGEDLVSQDEESKALVEAYKRVSDAWIGLVETLGEEPAAGLADYPLQAVHVESMFKEFDSDGDGGLSMEELDSAFESDMPDQYKSMSVDERRAEMKGLYSALDRNEDGKFTIVELTDFLIEMAEEVNEWRDELSSKQSDEQQASDSNETYDGGDSN